MTTAIMKDCDVFISHSLADSPFAAEIAESLQAVGLTGVYGGSISAGEDMGEILWQALAESRAMIVIFSPERPIGSMEMVELGAAAAWNKPIYLIVDGTGVERLPAVLQSEKYQLYPRSRLEEVINNIRRNTAPISEEEKTLLLTVYHDLKEPVDQLMKRPKSLQELTKKFNRAIGRQVSGEQLLSELLRLRKNGKLPRLKTTA